MENAEKLTAQDYKTAVKVLEEVRNELREVLPKDPTKDLIEALEGTSLKVADRFNYRIKDVLIVDFLNNIKLLQDYIDYKVQQEVKELQEKLNSITGNQA